MLQAAESTVKNVSSPSNKQQGLRVGIDIGGTFTDFVIFDPRSGQLSAFKLPTTPEDPSNAVLTGLNRIRNRWDLDPQKQNDQNGSTIQHAGDGSSVSVVHGSTVATNALLERKGALTALITTQGFKDVLQIGRQNRPKLYDLTAPLPKALIPEHLRFEVDERVNYQGEVLIPLDLAQVDELIETLKQPIQVQVGNGVARHNPQEAEQNTFNVESIAVCTLFSFLHPDHERSIAQRLREAGFFVSASHEVLPEYREYERMSTTAINAYVSPILDCYLKSLQEALLPAEIDQTQGNQQIRFHVMQSNGGSIGVGEARKMGVRCILSGPAGGVVGAKFAGEKALDRRSSTESPLRLLTFDMGGTSTDVSLIHAEPQITTESHIGGFPIRLPILDIHTIGAGGGSIATIDAGGSLRVGPQSAGAVPGPACYGRSEGESALPTVTDANLVLGYIDPERFLGGEMTIYPDLAWQAIKRLGEQVKMDPVQTAHGIIEITNAHMERALRVISIERGHDPRDFALLSFGGAGGLHAADLARSLGVPRVIVPPYAATFSAFGMLVADIVKDYTQTVMLPGDIPFRELAALFAPLVDRGRREVHAEGVPPEDILVDQRLDMRYEGQSYELNVPFEENFYDAFHLRHRRSYGYDRKDAPVEIVNLRVKITGRVPPVPMQPIPEGESNPAEALLTHRPVIMKNPQVENPKNETKSCKVPFYRGEMLQPGNVIEGPAVVVRDDTTVLIGDQDRASVDGFFNLHITINAKMST